MREISRSVADFISGSAEHSVAPDSSIRSAAERLKETNTGCVLVVDSGYLKGIFTERDYLNRVAGEDVAIDSTPVSQVMTPDPEFLTIRDDVAYALNMMAVGGYRNVPIVGTDGKIAGLVSIRDVIDHLIEVFVDEDTTVDEDWTDIGGG